MRASQGPGAPAGAVHLALLTCLAAVVVAPQIGLAAYAIGSADIRGALSRHPVAAFELAVAMAFWIGLFFFPLRALYRRLTWRRDVEITHDDVSVQDYRTFGGGAWVAPLSSYKGVAHHVLTSLSGIRHQLVLIHPDPARSVLLMTSEQIGDADVVRMSRLLGVPRVPAAELYRLGGSRKFATLSGNLEAAAA
jgi:hypothetical protein